MTIDERGEFLRFELEFLCFRFFRNEYRVIDASRICIYNVLSTISIGSVASGENEFIYWRAQFACVVTDVMERTLRIAINEYTEWRVTCAKQSAKILTPEFDVAGPYNGHEQIKINEEKIWIVFSLATVRSIAAVAVTAAVAAAASQFLVFLHSILQPNWWIYILKYISIFRIGSLRARSHSHIVHICT